jgi:hypothetical protein
MAQPAQEAEKAGKKRSRAHSGWYWHDVTPIGCWWDDANDAAYAVCKFMVLQPDGTARQCGHRLKAKGGADGMRTHAEKLHGLTEEAAKRSAAEKHVRLDNFFPPAPPECCTEVRARPSAGARSVRT